MPREWNWIDLGRGLDQIEDLRPITIHSIQRIKPPGRPEAWSVTIQDGGNSELAYGQDQTPAQALEKALKNLGERQRQVKILAETRSSVVIPFRQEIQSDLSPEDLDL